MSNGKNDPVTCPLPDDTPEPPHLPDMKPEQPIIHRQPKIPPSHLESAPHALPEHVKKEEEAMKYPEEDDDPNNIYPDIQKELSTAPQWNVNHEETMKWTKAKLLESDCVEPSNGDVWICFPYRNTINLQISLPKQGTIKVHAQVPTISNLNKWREQNHKESQLGSLDYTVDMYTGDAHLDGIGSGAFLKGKDIVTLTGKQLMTTVFKQLVIDTAPNKVEGDDLSEVVCTDKKNPKHKEYFPWKFMMMITKPIKLKSTAEVDKDLENRYKFIKKPELQNNEKAIKQIGHVIKNIVLEKIKPEWDKIAMDETQKHHVTWYQQFGFRIDSKKYKQLVEWQYTLMYDAKYGGSCVGNVLPMLQAMYQKEEDQYGNIVANCAQFRNFFDVLKDGGAPNTRKILKNFDETHGADLGSDMFMVFHRTNTGLKAMISPHNEMSYNHHHYGQSNHNQQGHVQEHHDGTKAIISPYNAISYNHHHYGQNNHNQGGHVNLHDGYYSYYDDSNYIQPSNHISYYNEMTVLVLSLFVGIGFICICVLIICIIFGGLIWKLRKKRESSVDRDDDDIISNCL